MKSDSAAENKRYSIDSRTADLAYMAVGAAIIAICSWISIPIAVPFTMQTFAVFLVLSVLGGKKGTVSIAVYVLLGLVGLPVFAGFKGGPAVLLGPTGGYILGFLITGILFIAITKAFGDSRAVTVAALIAGLAACYIFGTIWFMRLYSVENGAITLVTALSWCVFPFIVPDLAKLALAMSLSRRLRSIVAEGKTVQNKDEL